MESNAAVTLHFEDLAVQNYLFLKDVCICWWKISNCFKKHYWWIWFFFFFTILKTKCNSVRERAFFTLSRTLLYAVFKIFKKKNFAFSKSAFKNNLRFFTNECTHILKKQVIFYCKVLKMQRYSSGTLHVSPKNPISAEKLKITFSKIKNFPQKFFPQWFDPK